MFNYDLRARDINWRNPMSCKSNPSNWNECLLLTPPPPLRQAQASWKKCCRSDSLQSVGVINPKPWHEPLTGQLSYLNRWAFFLLAALLSHDTHRHSSGHVHKNTHGGGWQQEKQERDTWSRHRWIYTDDHGDTSVELRGDNKQDEHQVIAEAELQTAGREI